MQYLFGNFGESKLDVLSSGMGTENPGLRVVKPNPTQPNPTLSRFEPQCYRLLLPTLMKVVPQEAQKRNICVQIILVLQPPCTISK